MPQESVVIGPKPVRLTKRQEQEAYEAVTARDKGMCVRCGHHDTERDHRQGRSPYNTVVSNLQLLCGPFAKGCHLWKTEHFADAVVQGFTVPRWARPELWPGYRHDVGWVQYFDAPVDGQWWRVLDESTAHMLMGIGGEPPF